MASILTLQTHMSKLSRGSPLQALLLRGGRIERYWPHGYSVGNAPCTVTAILLAPPRTIEWVKEASACPTQLLPYAENPGNDSTIFLARRAGVRLDGQLRSLHNNGRGIHQ